MIMDRDILNILVLHEGSEFTNDPDDSGGPTRWGITIGTLSSWLGRPATIDEVRNLDRSTAETIYRSIYFQPFFAIPNPLRVNVIDMGVNAGIRRATYLVQKMVGAQIDGVMGNETNLKVNQLSKEEPLNEIFTGIRLAYYEDLILASPKNFKWRNGWRNRALSFTKLVPGMIIPGPTPEQSLLMAKA
jgi:lysozyme family protein